MKRLVVYLPLLLVLGVLLGSQPVWAKGPTPPGSLFRVPPTPAVGALPQASPTPEPTPLPAAAKPGPSGERLRLYWPLVGMAPAAATTAAARPEPIATSPITDHDARFIYQVQSGDSLNSLAIEFGRDQQSMLCATELDGSALHKLRPGQFIIVPALSDLCHRVQAGERLAQIAAWYGVKVEDLRAVPQNHLAEGAEPAVGQALLIPHARYRYRDPALLNLPRPQQQGWRYGDGQFVWPIAPESVVRISQGFIHGKHMATDLAALTGTPVHAADTGVVIKAGWNDSGYGYRIVIDHGIDYITLYAHLSEYYVQEGDVVQKGDIIGAVGSTGNSTGPHLHFEVRDYGYLIDPLLVLPSLRPE